MTPGNCIVIAFGASALGKTATATVTDNLGNAYSVGATPTTSVPRAMYYALNVAGGADNITVQFSTSQAFIELEIAEFSGVLSVNALDGSTSNSFTTATTTPNSGALTTTTSQDLLVCSFWGAGSPAITAGSNFFKIFTETGANTSMEYGISGPQGSYTGTWTFSVTETAQVQMIALKTIAPQAIANAANILTFSQRPLPGTLRNEYDVTPSQSYRFYAYLASSSVTWANGSNVAVPPYPQIADLDLIGQYASGVTAQTCTPTCSVPGGVFDLPVRVRLFCITTDATLYYTVDGTTPTTSSPKYTGPIVINSTWTAVDGTNYTIVPASLWPTTGSLGQPGIEATNIFYYNGTYFLLGSTLNVWASGINYYACTTASNPLSGWTFGANPFQSVAGGTPDYQTAYDTQTDTIINIGGRTSPCFIYVGDRYDVSNPSPGSSPTNIMQNWRPIILPITFPTPTSMSISWPASGQWNLDQSFPPVSGAPASPTGLATTGSGGAILSWTNNETTPHMLYLDRATDPGFTQNVVSEVLPMGTTSFSDTQVVVGIQYYYRVRAVNASGSSVSSPLSVTASNPSVLPTLQSFLGKKLVPIVIGK